MKAFLVLKMDWQIKEVIWNICFQKCSTTYNNCHSKSHKQLKWKYDEYGNSNYAKQ